MQQIPRHEQQGFLKLTSAMGSAYCLHTGEALPAGFETRCGHGIRPLNPAPFYLLLPMNEQGRVMKDFNVDELPKVPALSQDRARG